MSVAPGYTDQITPSRRQRWAPSKLMTHISFSRVHELTPRLWKQLLAAHPLCSALFR